MKAEEADAVCAIFRNELGDDGLELAPETALNDIPGWDSVNMACVVLAIEKKYGFTFRPAEFDEIETFGDFLTIIHRNVA